MADVIEMDSIAVEKKKQSALTKAVKRVVKKGKGKKVVKHVDKFNRGIIMLNHIPHGFYEKELRGFFSSFGKVLRVKVGRSKKTGKSRGYAFVEFEYKEVAEIAAKAMNNYLMFERLIKCEVVSSDQDPRKIFKDKNIRENNNPKLKARKKVKYEQNRVLSEEESNELLRARLAKLEEQNKKFAEMGIDYQFPVPKHAKDCHVRVKKDVGEDSDSKVSVDSCLRPPLAPSPEKKTPPKQKQQLKSPIEKKAVIEQVSEKIVAQDEAPSKGRKRKAPVMPKFSPKLLRSRKSNAPEMKAAEPKLTSDTIEDKVRDKSPQNQTKTKQRKSVAPEEKKKTPEKRMFSPKLLRSRKSQGAPKESSDEVKNTAVKMKKVKDLPKISPKMLRSRKSDGAGLTPSTGKGLGAATPTANRKGGRKSVF